MTPVRTLALFTAAAALLCHGAVAQEFVVTRPTAASVDPSTIITPPPSTTVSRAPTASAADDPLPANAPKDDYEFVGWCAGILTGHMQLYEQVEPTLKQISKRWNTEAHDEEENLAKQKIGRDILTGFADAMRAAEGASAAAIASNGLRAIAQGRGMWATADTVDANTRAYSWMNWALPGRCEATAAKLKSRSTLMGAALRDNTASAVQTSAVRLVGERPDEPTSQAAAKPETVAAAEPVVEPVPAGDAALAAATAILTPTAPPPVASVRKPAPARTAPPAARTPAPKPTPIPSKAVGLR